MTAPRSESAETIEGWDWDVIVIGTGMGGATLGYRLAEGGKRVLFCEKGKSHLAAPEAVVGYYPELHGRRQGAALDRQALDLLQSAGRYCDEVVDESSKHTRRSIPFIGSGTGGSSALYGMALERFFPSDFFPRANHPLATDTSLEEAWPISYEALLPYYAEAERLYRVRGTVDPLRSTLSAAELLAAPELTQGGEELCKFFRSKQLHPYRLPMACEFVVGCRGCQGYLCDRDCKNDSSKVCLRPAVATFGAVLLDECEVLSIGADQSRATEVFCRRRGEVIRLRGKTIVLAAGALQTPNILLRSRSAYWQDGLANQSGMVGRNLMRHFVDLYLIKPERRDAPEVDNRFKELAFNDFYQMDDVKLGSVQSFGRLPPAPVLFGSLQQDLRGGHFSWAAPLLPLVRPVLMPFLDRMVRRPMVMATTLEDLPYLDNRVGVSLAGSNSDLMLHYRIKAEGRDRIRKFRQLMAATLGPRRWRMVRQAENNQRIAHICGTCRFGSNPRTSALDKNNRAHGLDNLYVVDSSFFPSSGGTNPSLTIAANALRVADYLLGRTGPGVAAPAG